MKKLIFASMFSLALLSPARASSGPPDGFTVALGGDMIGPYHPLPGPEDTSFGRIADLFRKADLGFANQEGSILDLAQFTGFPAAETGGGYLQQLPEMASAMRSMGLTIVSKANNHATDFGTEGLVTTLKYLKDAGVAQAGAGVSEAEARAPGFVQTPKGIAALVDCASTFTPLSQAGAAVLRHGKLTNARPGISVLHLREVRLVPSSEIEHLRALGEDSFSPPTEARIGDIVFRAADRDGWLWEMSPTDHAAILSSVNHARVQAGFVLFSIHAHETAGHDDQRTPAAPFEAMAIHRADEAPSPLDTTPAEFETTLFHEAIDAGADAVVRTGPHVLQGIEIYQGRPIFYGLGGLFFDRDGRKGHAFGGGIVPFPVEQFEGIVPVTTYRHGKPASIHLHPVVLVDDPAETRGIPHPAEGEQALQILRRVQSLSAPFGTKIEIRNGEALIRLP